MDPDACLAEIRQISAALARDRTPALSLERQAELGRDLAEHIDDLDHWLTTGGFKPQEWRKHGSR